MAGAAPGSRELPERRGLWYRVHPADGLDLDQGKARSRAVPLPGAGQSGLSAFASPHHLYAYVKAMDWGGRGWLHGYDDGATPRRVIAFHGRETGRGAEDEPLVRPEPDMRCCGRALHADMAWSTFTRRLPGTPAPPDEWSPARAVEMERLRASGQRGLHRRPRWAPRFSYHHAPYENGTHWFSADNRLGYEVGHALVVERDGPGGDHVEITNLEVDRNDRRKGVGSQLIGIVAWHFSGREVRLKPYPEDHGSGQTTEDLREYYANRGFEPYRLKPGDPFGLWDYMTLPGGGSAARPGVVVFEHDGALPPAAGEAPQGPPALLPPRQQAALDAARYETHRRRMLEVAVNPEPGTRVWRSEQRPWDEAPATVEAAGARWRVNPDTITRPPDEPGMRTVIWQAVIDQPDAQLVPRADPDWQRLPSPDSSAEVRFRPGSRVRVEGAWVADACPRDRGHFLPAAPGRMGDGWRWHQVARHLTVGLPPAAGGPGGPSAVPRLPSVAAGPVGGSSFPGRPLPRPAGTRPSPAARPAGLARTPGGARRSAS